jgi:alpha-D-ribose 1-methylphosphonate 5-triphosphate synthase subunit PhnL
MIVITGAAKTFTMHLQNGVRLPVVSGVSMHVNAGECVVLAGPSGAGKSSILKMIFGNYRCDQGHIAVQHGGEMVDIATAQPREVLRVRRQTIGYVSQFLCRAARPRAGRGGGAVDRKRHASRRCTGAGRIVPASPEHRRKASLPPSTFSGGEQQRVNIARGFISDMPILLLDEPTASLDAANRKIVVELVAEKKKRGGAMVAVVHDDDVRNLIADRVVDVTSFAAAA